MPNEPERVDLASPDLAAQNRETLAANFPGVLADGVLDAARLGEILGVEVTGPDDGRERFGLMWAGKADSIRSLQTPSHGTLVPDFERSVDWDHARNVFIEGDNLEALKLLQKSYNDKIKLAYIDPPYNTGNDFIYNDNFQDGLKGYLEYTGQTDAEGRRVSTSTDAAGGRRHSKWLNMMYPRLVLARNLLGQDGILCVSIDDHEVANLRSLLDEVFGPENFVGTFVWVSNIKGRQISGAGPAGTKEYLHVYARNIDKVEGFRASAAFLKERMPSVYKGFDYQLKSDERGAYVTKNELYNTNSMFNEATRPNLVFDIYYNPRTLEVRTEPVSDVLVHKGFVKIPPKQNNNGVNKYHAFRWGRPKVEAESFDLEFVEGPTGYKVYTKVRDVDSTSVKDLFMDISTNAGSNDLEAIGLDPSWFDYPKPVDLIQIIVAFATDSDSLVCDFFAGSGTTAHAVAVQNALDGGQRTTLSINLPELLDEDSEAAKAGLATVADVGFARIKKIMDAVPQGSSMGLRVLALGESNFLSELPAENSDLLLSRSTLGGLARGMDSIAAEVLIKEGVPLDAPWGRYAIDGVEVVVAGGVVVVLSTEITAAVVSEVFAQTGTDKVVVFLEDGFAGLDALKANAFTNAKQLGVRMKTV